jgi:hypothetical protein
VTAAAGSAADQLIGDRRVGGSDVVDAQDGEECRRGDSDREDQLDVRPALLSVPNVAVPAPGTFQRDRQQRPLGAFDARDVQHRSSRTLAVDHLPIVVPCLVPDHAEDQVDAPGSPGIASRADRGSLSNSVNALIASPAAGQWPDPRRPYFAGRLAALLAE